MKLSCTSVSGTTATEDLTFSCMADALTTYATLHLVKISYIAQNWAIVSKNKIYVCSITFDFCDVLYFG